MFRSVSGVQVTYDRLLSCFLVAIGPAFRLSDPIQMIKRISAWITPCNAVKVRAYLSLNSTTSDLDMACSQKTIRYSCQKTKWFRWMFKLGGVALEAILDKVLYGRSSQGREHGGHSSQFP